MTRARARLGLLADRGPQAIAMRDASSASAAFVTVDLDDGDVCVTVLADHGTR